MISAANLELFDYIFALAKSPYIANVALFFSYYLSFSVIIIVIFWSVFFNFKESGTFLFLSLSAFGAWVFSYLLKILYLTNRPFAGGDITPLVYAGGFSFPSMHAAVMGAFAAAGFFIDNRLGMVLMVFAFLIGISRILIGVHYPVDVLGGWVVGYLSALLFVKYFRKI